MKVTRKQLRNLINEVVNESRFQGRAQPPVFSTMKPFSLGNLNADDTDSPEETVSSGGGLKSHKTPNYPHSYPADKSALHKELEDAWNAQGPKDGHDPYYFISDSGKTGVYLGPDVRITNISKSEAEEYKARGAQLIYCQDSRGLDQGNWGVDYVIGRSSPKRDQYYNYAPGSSADRDSW